jgi:hypothetical protein
MPETFDDPPGPAQTPRIRQGLGCEELRYLHGDVMADRSAMVRYQDDGILPAPRAAVWRLLEAHLDDATISAIHPLVLQQTTVERGTEDTIVDRIIDARGRKLRSRWKLTFHRPDSYRWEILHGEGPWRTGTFAENTYSETPEGTRIVTHGELHISVLPFFIPQSFMVRRILNEIDREDVAHLSRIARG